MHIFAAEPLQKRGACPELVEGLTRLEHFQTDVLYIDFAKEVQS